MSAPRDAAAGADDETEDERYEKSMQACFRKIWGATWASSAPGGMIDLLKQFTGLYAFARVSFLAWLQSSLCCCPEFYRNDDNRLPEYKSWIPAGQPARALASLAFRHRILVARAILAIAQAFDWPCEVGDEGHTIFKYFSSLNFAGAAQDGLPEWLLEPGEDGPALGQLWYSFAKKVAGSCSAYAVLPSALFHEVRCVLYFRGCGVAWHPCSLPRSERPGVLAGFGGLCTCSVLEAS